MNGRKKLGDLVSIVDFRVLLNFDYTVTRDLVFFLSMRIRKQNGVDY